MSEWMNRKFMTALNWKQRVDHLGKNSSTEEAGDYCKNQPRMSPEPNPARFSIYNASARTSDRRSISLLFDVNDEIKYACS